MKGEGEAPAPFGEISYFDAVIIVAKTTFLRHLPSTHHHLSGRGSRQKVRDQVSKFRMPSYENLGVGVPSLSSRQEVRS